VEWSGLLESQNDMEKQGFTRIANYFLSNTNMFLGESQNSPQKRSCFSIGLRHFMQKTNRCDNIYS